VWRPADLFETAVAWQTAIERRDAPTALALTRQNTPPQAHPAGHHELALRGGYVLWEPAKAPEALIMATGSEVGLAMDAAKKLAEQKRFVRVVSMPCVQRFLQQDAGYREQVLPKKITRRLAVEAGVSWYWRPLVGDAGDVLGVDRFGESAPAPAVYKVLGVTVENAVAKVEALFRGTGV